MSIAFNSIDKVVRDISMADTVLSVADGAMTDIRNDLVKIRSLAVQAASKDLSSSERMLLEIEKDGLLEDIARIADNTEINGLVLLDGTLVGKKFQAGFAEQNYVYISIQQSMSVKGLDIRDICLDGGDRFAAYVISKVDVAIDVVNEARANIIGLRHEVESAKSGLEKLVFNACVEQCFGQGDFESLVGMLRYEDITD